MGFEHSETRFLDLGRPGSTTQELYRMEPQTVVSAPPSHRRAWGSAVLILLLPAGL